MEEKYTKVISVGDEAINYLENIKYYLYVAKNILSPEKCSRIQSYVATTGNDLWWTWIITV